MKRPLRVTIIALLLGLATAASGFAQTLQTPFIDESTVVVDARNISLTIVNPDEIGTIELYRSYDQVDWQLIATGVGGYMDHTDHDVRPRHIVAYKVRVVQEEVASEFSRIVTIESGSTWYNPELTAVITEDRVIELTLRDNSYADLSYTLMRKNSDGTNSGNLVDYINMADSGRTFTYIDGDVNENETYIYWIQAELMNPNYETLPDVASVNITIEPEPLVPPSFSSAGFPVYENNIIFGIYNPNEESETQIFRSMNAAGPFNLIATIPFTEIAYYDQDLKPRTTFYYKLRASIVEHVSEFSPARAYTSGSKLYAPEITGVGKSFSVDLTFVDRSYDDVSYGVVRSAAGSSTSKHVKTIVASDSGQVFHFTDTGLAPNTTYHYRVEAYTKGPGNPYYDNLAGTSVTTGEEVIIPEFATPNQTPCGTAVAFGVLNYNENAMVEIYRSVSPDDGFELHYTLDPGVDNYVDGQLPPRTTFYYTLRAIAPDGSASEFTEILELTSGSDFFSPLLDGTRGEEPNTIQLTFNDRSYADSAYHIYKTYKDRTTEEDVTELLQTLVLPDSGAAATIIDTLNSGSGEFRYSVNAILACEGNPVYYEVAGDTLYLFPHELYAPYIVTSVPTGEHCGNLINFHFINENGGSETEIWRSGSFEGPYEMIATRSEIGIFEDTTVIAGASYFYKLRANAEGEVSEFSEAMEFKAEPQFNAPQLNIFYTDEGATVELQLEDRSNIAAYYELYVYVENQTFDSEYDLTWSEGAGNVYSFITGPIPGYHYEYTFDMTLKCGTNDILIEDVVSRSFDVPDGPAVYEFVLIDPYTDEEVRKLWPLGEGFDAQPRYNIRAVANDLTQSVEFHLNEVRFWGENQEPYALFGDRFGNYNPGRLKPGEYILSATAYSGNQQKGKKGNTITVMFEVYDNGTMSLLTDGPSSTVRMNVFPNPVVSHAEIEISGMPDESVSMQLIDESGNAVEQMNEVLGHDGLLLKQWDASSLRKGTYFIYIKMKDETLTRRIIVD